MPNIMEVSDLTLPALDVFTRLTEAQLRNRLEAEKGVFIAESPKVIARALDAGCEPLSLLMERKHIDGQGRDIISRCGDIPVYTANREVLADLTGYALTRGVLCAMRRPPLPSVEELCAGARRVAVLEGIVDSTNIGAIFRSAAALRMDAVLVTPTCSDPLYRRAVRVSMGTVFQVPWTRIGDRKRGWSGSGRWASKPPPWLCATIPSASKTPGWRRRSVSPLCWARRATAWRSTPSPAATTRCVSPWPTAWTP